MAKIIRTGTAGREFDVAPSRPVGTPVSVSVSAPSKPVVLDLASFVGMTDVKPSR